MNTQEHVNTQDMIDTSDLTPRKRFRSNVRWLVLGLVLGATVSAVWSRYQRQTVQKSVAGEATQEPAESYQVVSHEASSGEWVIIAVNREEGRRVQITAACDFYKFGNRDPVKGPNSCNLLVGRTLFPNRLGTRPGEFLDVWQLGDTLFISQGKGDDRVHQQFTIRSAKVLE